MVTSLRGMFCQMKVAASAQLFQFINGVVVAAVVVPTVELAFHQFHQSNQFQLAVDVAVEVAWVDEPMVHHQFHQAPGVVHPVDVADMVQPVPDTKLGRFANSPVTPVELSLAVTRKTSSSAVFPDESWSLTVNGGQTVSGFWPLRSVRESISGGQRCLVNIRVIEFVEVAVVAPLPVFGTPGVVVPVVGVIVPVVGVEVAVVVPRPVLGIPGVVVPVDGVVGGVVVALP